jgi:hypothetical protein
MEAMNNPADKAERLVIKLKYTHPIEASDFFEHVNGIQRQYTRFMSTYYPDIKPVEISSHKFSGTLDQFNVFTETTVTCAERLFRRNRPTLT